MPTILADDILKSTTTSSSSASNQSPFGRQENVELNIPIARSQHGADHLTSAKTDRYPTSTHEMQKRCKDRDNHIGFKHRRPRRVVSFKSPPPPPPPPPAASRLQHAGCALLKSVSTVFLRTKGGRDEQNEQRQQQQQVTFPDPKTVYPSLPDDDVSINSNEISRFPSFSNRSRYEQTYQDDGEEEAEEDSRLDLFTVSPTRVLYTYNESHFSELTPS